MTMNSSLQALQKAREEVIFSREWEEINRALITQLQHLEYLQGGGRFRDFASLSNQEKISALAKATRSLEKTEVFSDFQAKVFRSVDHQFSYVTTGTLEESTSDGSMHASSSSQTDKVTDSIVEACTQLLQQWPHLIHRLKKCINHSLPPKLRAVAWHRLLLNPPVRQDFIAKVAAQEGLPELTTEDRRLNRRCEVLLSSNPLFHEMAESTGILRGMKNTALYWKLRSEGNVVSDTELLLCIPFLYVRREELSEMGGERGWESWSTVAEVVEQYVSFMEMLPLTMHSVVMDQALEAMNKFSQQVEQLLISQDQRLHRALTKVFGCPRHLRAPSAISQEAQLPFHKRLRNLIRPHTQKMLVGDVSMEVLCYIWDQCFIGFSTPDYQCLPYFITTWLILLRDQLLKCHTTEAIEQALITHSPSLHAHHFQEQIEKRFLRKLSSHLGVTPIKQAPQLSPTAHKPTTIAPGLHEQATDAPIDLSTQAERPPVARETSQPVRRAAPREDSEGELLKRQIVELQKQLDQERTALADQLTKEREEHKREMSSLIKEIRQLNQTVSQGLTKSDSQASTSTGAVSSVPTNMTLVSPIGSSGYVLSPHLGGIQVFSPQAHALGNSIQPLQVIPIVQQSSRPGQDTQLNASESSMQPVRPYSPSHLSENNIQDIWLKILSRFTNAAYTVCHGTTEERQRLHTELQDQPS